MGAKGTQRHQKALKGTPNLNRMTSEAQSLDPPTRIEDLPAAEHELLWGDNPDVWRRVW